MTEMAILLLSVSGGLVLGAVFFGGLWWTVARGLRSPIPGLWFLGSVVLRTAIVLMGFWLISQRHWDRMLSCLVGFVIARIVLTRFTSFGPAAGIARAELERQSIDAAYPG